jgi:hypothetical protein
MGASEMALRELRNPGKSEPQAPYSPMDTIRHCAGRHASGSASEARLVLRADPLRLLWRTAVMVAPDEDAVPLLALGDRSGEGMHTDGAL